MGRIRDAALGRNSLNFSWLIKLRWSSIAGQTATILAVYVVLGLEVPLVPLFCVVGIEALSNVVCALWFKRDPDVYEWHLAGVMSLDIALLTALLFFTGGPFNPFSSLYLVNIALAAVALHAQWTWMLVALALLSFGILPLLDYRPLPLSHLPPGERAMMVQQGMWTAFGVAAGFIVHFLWRVTRALSQQEALLAEAQKQAAQRERLASLATVAAGAAHELATPLGTIALVAKELERQLSREGAAESVEDAVLIRQQVARCRAILDQMAAGTGKSTDQTVESVTLRDLIDEAIAGTRSSPGVSLAIDNPEATLALPRHAVAQALRGLVTNAQDASEGAAVELSASVADNRLSIEVADRGVGISDEIMKRIGEPFFTTKAPGSGMGLGVYLGRAVVERLGGSLEIARRSGGGTVARVQLPAVLDAPDEREYPSEAHELQQAVDTAG